MKQINVRMTDQQFAEICELEQRLGECKSVALRMAIKHALATLPLLVATAQKAQP